MKLSYAAETVISRLNACGYEAYAVGGAVRDSLIGLTPHDFDVATGASPSAVTEIFRDLKVIKTGIKHGTVTALVGDEPIEVTTFRRDGGYTDGRHPDGVSFTSELSEDLKRRDFTVNAMAYSEKSGLIDPFGGENDLKNGILRTVGDPCERFGEDALRILRALRFASVYGFKIEENTDKAIRKLKGTLSRLSAERVLSEMRLLIIGNGAEDILLAYPEIVTEIFPELSECVGFCQHSPYHVYDVYVHTVKTVSACPKDVTVRLAALLHDCGKPDTFELRSGRGHFISHAAVSAEKARAALKRLKADTKTAETVYTLIKYHDIDIDVTPESVKLWLMRLSPEVFLKLTELKIADNSAKGGKGDGRLRKCERLKALAEDILKKDECYSLKQLKICGDDLVLLGVPRGRAVGEALGLLLDAVISGRCENDKTSLIKYLTENASVLSLEK